MGLILRTRRKKMSFSVMLQQLAGGMLVSIEIFFVTLLFSLPLGLLICFGRMSRNKVIRTIVSGYISIMRGTPLMLQLMVVYFGPYFIFGIRTVSYTHLTLPTTPYVYICYQLCSLLCRNLSRRH